MLDRLLTVETDLVRKLDRAAHQLSRDADIVLGRRMMREPLTAMPTTPLTAVSATMGSGLLGPG